MARARWLLVVLVLLWATSACGVRSHGLGGGDASPGECIDNDGDGYGTGPGCIDEDCDDWNPEMWSHCIGLCDEDPHATGCPCSMAESPEPEICYTGPEGTLGVGTCLAGLRRCLDGGHWSPCVGQVLPSMEVCDYLDDDCDGEVDEGVRNECGTCAADCDESCVGAGEGCAPFDPEGEGDGVEHCEGIPDCVTLGADAVPLHVIWIVDTSRGTISKIDTDTREELGRYYTSPEMGAVASPSRTSVDYRGDVVVANRRFSGQASATKLAWDCPAGDTSSGGDDVLPWGDDSCMIWHTEVGNPNGIARATAVQDHVGLDGVMNETVWIGLYSERRYVELDRTDGEPTGEEADVSPCNPYGAALDRDGMLWSACLSTRLSRFDTTDTRDVETIVLPRSNYGIAIDGEGNVWMGGTCQKYDPVEEEVTVVDGCSGSGIAADGEGFVWVGDCSGGGGMARTCRIEAETLEVTPVMARSRGFGVTFSGEIWGVTGSEYSIITPNEPGEEEVEVVGYGLTYSYCYTDMTGFQNRLSTNPEGFYGHVFEGCDGLNPWTEWTSVTWEVSAPAGSDIVLSVRAAESLWALSKAPWAALGSVRDLESPTDLGDALGPAPHGKYLEVRFTLRASDVENRPRLLGIGAQYACEL